MFKKTNELKTNGSCQNSLFYVDGIINDIAEKSCGQILHIFCKKHGNITIDGLLLLVLLHDREKSFRLFLALITG